MQCPPRNLPGMNQLYIFRRARVAFEIAGQCATWWIASNIWCDSMEISSSRSCKSRRNCSVKNVTASSIPVPRFTMTENKTPSQK